MSESTKNQFYRYSMRTTVAHGTWCARAFAIKQFPPDNAQSLENLFLHLRIEFNSSMATAAKVLHRVCVVSGFPAYGRPQDESWFRELILDEAAVSGIVDIKLDLTSLIDKAAVDDTYVYVETANLNDFLSEASAGDGGDIWICKLDGIYTTREIR